MEKDLQQQYLDTESNSRLFFDTFFELCRKFNIQYSIATTQEKAFIDEVTESIYERKKAERDGKAPHISAAGMMILLHSCRIVQLFRYYSCILV